MLRVDEVTIRCDVVITFMEVDQQAGDVAARFTQPSPAPVDQFGAAISLCCVVDG